MRHGVKLNPLGRKRGHRDALLKNLSIALITHKRINTTLAKAKALRGFIEPLVTKAKDNTTHSRRLAFSELQNKEAIKELFDVIGPKVGDRPGGYVRVIKTGFRKGDGADTALIEFVDFNDIYSLDNQGQAKKSKSRRGRSGGKSGSNVAAAAAAATAAPVVGDAISNEEE